MNPIAPEFPAVLKSNGPKTALLCGVLLLVFAMLSWTATRGKSPTADEPYHSLAGWLHLWHNDYRLDTEDPPLWCMYAALAAGPQSIKANFDSYNWQNLPLATDQEYAWQVHTLFRTPGNDADAFIRRFRAMMLAVSVTLGAGLCFGTWWMAREIGAPPAVATLVAATLFAFDPNLLAHASLMKNDLACALTMLGIVITIWRIGQKPTLRRMALLGLWVGLALTVKFTGVLLVFIAIALLAVRLLLPAVWSKLRMVCLAVVISAPIAVVMIWLVYGLRFRPAAAADSVMDLGPVMRMVADRQWEAQHSSHQQWVLPTTQQSAGIFPPLICRVVGFADQHRLFPQAWLAGLLFTYQSTLVRGEYLCGQTSPIGWWWYFPFALLVKTPVATLAAGTLALLAAVSRPEMFKRHLWSWLCLVIPVAIYFAAAMRMNLNLGLRHLFPIFPLMFMAIALIAAKLWQSRPRLAAVTCGLLAMGLIVETCSAFPNFIPFFNIAAGGSRGGLRYLSDSNLDWGQDLPLLANWQREHPDTRLYLATFGTSDPAYYGIRYTNLPQGYYYGPPPQPLDAPGVIAISATTLQGPYTGRVNGQPFYSGLYRFKPLEVLGGSIYLFRFPPVAEDQLPPGKWLINPAAAGRE